MSSKSVGAPSKSESPSSPKSSSSESKADDKQENKPPAFPQSTDNMSSSNSSTNSVISEKTIFSKFNQELFIYQTLIHAKLNEVRFNLMPRMYCINHNGQPYTTEDAEHDLQGEEKGTFLLRYPKQELHNQGAVVVVSILVNSNYTVGTNAGDSMPEKFAHFIINYNCEKSAFCFETSPEYLFQDLNSLLVNSGIDLYKEY